MESNIYRKKLLNAVLYFARKTKFPNITKISKLLYFFDFTHFKQTGYPSIGLEYFTFPQGPVPRSFWLEVRDGIVPEDFKDKLALIPKKVLYDLDHKEHEFKSLKNPDLNIFTQREVKILEDLALIFKDVNAREISEISHFKNQPWETTMKQKGKNVLIDYLLAIDNEAKIDKEEAKESLKEHFDIVKNFQLEPAEKHN